MYSYNSIKSPSSATENLSLQAVRGQIHTVEVPLPLELCLRDAVTDANAARIRAYAKDGYAEDLEAGAQPGGWEGDASPGLESIGWYPKNGWLIENGKSREKWIIWRYPSVPRYPTPAFDCFNSQWI